jgi:hypothetical protein
MRVKKTFPAGRLLMAMVVAGIGLVAAATSAHASSPVPPRATAALAFDVNGHWTDNGTAKPVITTAAGAIVIDMSYAHRPNATGTVLDGSSVLVTFPDADTYIGTFLAPTVLQWSNGSVWRKVFSGPLVFGLNENWTDGRTDQHIFEANGYLTINMSATHRPNAVGFAVSPSMFRVSFPDDRDTTFATLDAVTNRITWSNGSQWWLAPLPPGNPDCLLILC